MASAGTTSGGTPASSERRRLLRGEVTQTLVEVLGMVAYVRLVPHLVPAAQPAPAQDVPVAR